MLKVSATEKATVRFTLNGRPVTAQAQPRMQLADLLRHVLKQYGTHVGCEHGICGACTVLVDGRAVRSCLIYAVQVDGASIVTIEGHGDGRWRAERSATSVPHDIMRCSVASARPAFWPPPRNFLPNTRSRPSTKCATCFRPSVPLHRLCGNR